jgi:hypothetical protein
MDRSSGYGTVIGTKIYYPSRNVDTTRSLVYDSALNQWESYDAIVGGDLLTIENQVWSLSSAIRFDPSTNHGTRFSGVPFANVVGEADGTLYGFTADDANIDTFFKVPIQSIQRIWVKK